MVLMQNNIHSIGPNYLDIQEIATPPNPSTQTDRIYCFSRGGESILMYIDSNGNVKILSGVDIWRTRKPIRTKVDNGAFTHENVPVRTSETGTVFNTIATDADGPLRSLTTDGTINHDAGSRCGSLIRGDFNVDVTWKIKLVSVTNICVWIGYSASDIRGIAAPTTAHFGVVMSTAAGNTNFLISNCDGASGAATQAQIQVQDTNVHTFRLVSDNTNTRWGYSVDGAAITWISTNIPAMTTSMDVYATARNITGAAAVTWGFYWWEGSSDK